MDSHHLIHQVHHPKVMHLILSLPLYRSLTTQHNPLGCTPINHQQDTHSKFQEATHSNQLDSTTLPLPQDITHSNSTTLLKIQHMFKVESRRLCMFSSHPNKIMVAKI